MNLTQQQAIDLLGKAGVKDVVIVADDAADAAYNPDEALRVIDDARVAFHRPLIEKEVSDTANASAAGRYGAIMRQNIAKATGIPVSELMKIEKDADAIAHAVSKHKELLSSDERTRTEAMERERSEWAEEKKKLEEEWNSKLKAQVDKFNDREIDSYIADNLKDAPLLATADRATVAKLLKNELRNNYDLEFDEASKRAKVIDRTTKLEARNAANNNTFDLKEFAEKALTPYGLWAKNMSNVNPADALAKHAANGSMPPPPKMDMSKDPVVAKREQLIAAQPTK